MADSNSSKNKKYKTKKHWPPKEELLLIRIWKDRISELRRVRKNRHIYEEISQQLDAKGCFADVDEVKTKCHNLTTRYRKEKAAFVTYGSHSEWHLFRAMDKAMGSLELDNVVDLMGEISTCLDGTSQQSACSNKSEGDSDSYEYVNEDVYDKEEDDTGATTSDYNEPDAISTKYLESINSNIESLVERINELSERMLAMEESGNATLAKLLKVLYSRTVGAAADNCSGTPAKKIKLSEDDGLLEQISNFDSNPLHNDFTAAKSSFPSQRNTVILEDYLKTKQLEREFMSEKHKIQIEILKLELEAKRKEALK